MRSRHQFAIIGLAAILSLSACAHRTQLASASPSRPLGRLPSFVGSWSFETGGMRWLWTFEADASFEWSILGLHDMGERILEVKGRGNCLFEGGSLILYFQPFEGVPGIFPAGKAAPGFDQRSDVVVRFGGADSMLWKFSTKAWGPEELRLSRSR
jgi:hypothetical protein